VVATPIYRSTAVVILETNQKQLLDLKSVVGGLSGDTSEINSEVEVLRARSLIGKVVDRLELVSDPEFNGALRTPSKLQTATSKFKIAVKSLLGMSKPANEVSEGKQERDSVITSLLAATTVRNIPMSLVFQVAVETEDPHKSVLIADTIVELYILNQIEVKFEATEQAALWLSNRVSELQISLKNAEAKVSEFSSSTDLISIEGLQALERQIKDLRDRIDVAQNSRTELAAQIAALETAETLSEKAAVAADTQLTDLLARTQNDTSFRTAFNNRFDSVLNRLRANLSRADQQLIALRNSEIALAEDLDGQGKDLITLQQYTREAEATRVLYGYFLARFNETAAQQGIQQADSRILSNAVVPLGASEPRKSLILAMSGMLGLMVGVGLILIREARNNGIRTAAALEQITGYAVLGQVPQIPANSRRKVVQYLINKPMSAAAEAYRNLRTSLMLSHIDNPPKVIILTSSIPGEGKTTNAIALAQNYIGLGKNVLLVDGDIRRRTLNKYFDNIPTHGIISVMSGVKTLSEAVFKSAGLGVDILAGEKASANAADLFSSDAFKSLIAQARVAYDVVIIDAPPILVVPDARIIAGHADAVIFTVYWDKTTKTQVEESLRIFHNSGQRITGLVLSQISTKGMQQYGYADHYGAYSKYGSDYYIN